MGIPVVIVTSGGLGVTVVSSGGLPMTVATSGYGIPVMSVANGLPVTGITFGPDVTAPIITSSNAISQPENSILNHVLAANEAVTWAKVGGADTAKFTLVGNTLTLPAKDFENPDDAGLNNTYIVQVQATDLASNVSLVQTITVTITDVFEVGPTAPVLAMDAAWVTTDDTPDFTIDVDDTIGAGDSVRLQIAVAGTSFAAPVDDVTHVITAPEDAANEIDVASGSVANGNYEARARVDNGTPSAWSNTVTFTVAAVATGRGLLWGTSAIVWGADYMTWEVPAYAGPGDVVAGALGWYSPARAYTTAFAALGGPIMDITTAADGALTTINILPTGLVDLVALNAWITTNGTPRVKQLYDQSGNLRHVLNATTAARPTLTVSALNGLPALTGTAAASTVLQSSATFTQAQPYTFVAVAKRTGAFTTQSVLIGSSGANNNSMSFYTSANTVDVTSTGAGGNHATLAGVTDNVFHALQGVVNGATGLMSADGVDSATAAVGATGYSANTMRILRAAGGASLEGQCLEVGMWPGALNSTQRSNLNANMHGPYGYNF